MSFWCISCIHIMIKVLEEVGVPAGKTWVSWVTKLAQELLLLSSAELPQDELNPFILLSVEPNKAYRQLAVQLQLLDAWIND